MNIFIYCLCRRRGS